MFRLHAPRTPRPALAAALALLLAGPGLRAQGVAPALAGMAAGSLVGAGAALGGSVALARFAGQTVDGPAHLADWRVAVAGAGALSGLVLGASDRGGLRDAALVAGLAGALGAGVGALVGRERWSDPAGPWSGAALGAGAGLLAGWVVGALVGRDGGGDGPAETLTLGWTLPLGAGGGLLP